MTQSTLTEAIENVPDQPASNQDTEPIERTPPDVPDDPVMPDTCLSFTIESSWGHFRKPETTTAYETCELIPRTTVAGLIAGILGYERNTYYDHFTRETADIAISPVNEVRSMPVPQNYLTTNSDAKESVTGRSQIRIGGETSGKMNAIDPDGTQGGDWVGRQRQPIEVLAEPAYRIELRVASETLYNHIKQRLENQSAYYPPSMGKSQYIARMTYHGEYTVNPEQNPSEPVEVHSAIPDATRDIVPDPQADHRIERSTAAFTTDKRDETTERHMTGMINWSYSRTGEPLTTTADTSILTPTGETDGGERRVIFS